MHAPTYFKSNEFLYFSAKFAIDLTTVEEAQKTRNQIELSGFRTKKMIKKEMELKRKQNQS